MRHLSRVVWSEGMYLGPHHFQLQNRYFEDSIRFAISSLWFEPWGLGGYELDREALTNGTVSLVHARGIFADGLPFQIPESDAAPEARSVAEVFPPARESLLLSLAVPVLKPGGANCADAADANGSSRYVAEERVLHDEVTGLDSKPVRLGRKRIRFLFDTEAAGGMERLPIARIRRDGAGHYIYDARFIPPCLSIAASGWLLSITGRLIDILEEKSAALSQGKRAHGSSWAEYSTRDIASFWMLHAVNSALAPLRHLFLTRRSHPEELYTEMARLGGALCTFAIESHPRSLPAYDHRNLEETFGALDEHIRAHLETIVPTNCISIPLEAGEPYFYQGTVADPRCTTAKSRWVLAARAGLGEAEIIGRVPQLVKVCSRLFVPELVKRALPGMTLTHLPVPPAAVPARVDTQYFSITMHGPCWDHIVKTKEVGVYVPGELPSPEVELLVVLEA